MAARTTTSMAGVDMQKHSVRLSGSESDSSDSVLNTNTEVVDNKTLLNASIDAIKGFAVSKKQGKEQAIDTADASKKPSHDCFSYKGWRGKSESSEEEDTGADEADELLQVLASGSLNLREILRQLLESGGDERSVTNPATGLTKYHTPSVPCADIHRSCCTSNAPSEEAFRRGVDTLRQLVLEAKNASRLAGREVTYGSPEDLFRKLLCDIRERLRAIFGLSCEDNISLFPSGTDAELMPSLLALARALSSETRGSQVYSIITAAGEVGSGTLQASTGQDFAKRLPSGRRPDGGSIFDTSGLGQGAGLISGASMFMRDECGRLLSPEARDRRVEEAVDEAAAEVQGSQPRYGCILVHMVVGSKTGKCMPSPECLDRIVAKHGSLVLPVVDACQGRMGESDIRQHLDKGRVVLCTGSKFFGGPPFSGVCLMSEDLGLELERKLSGDAGVLRLVAQSRLKEYVVAALMSDDLPTLRSMLPQRPLNYGVLMRWTLALHGMEAYYAEVPQAARVQIMRDWTAAVQNLLRDTSDSLLQPIADQHEGGAQDEQSVALSTIVSFHCYCNRGTPATSADNMTMEELRHLQLLMATDLSVKHPQLSLLGHARTRCFMGQPVDLCPQGAGQAVVGMHVLRVAASAPLIVRIWREGLDAVLEEDRAIFAKLGLILGNWSVFASS